MNTDFVERMRKERNELEDKIIKIRRFQDTPQYVDLSPEERYLLETQLGTMQSYYSILQLRINLYD